MEPNAGRYNLSGSEGEGRSLILPQGSMPGRHHSNLLIPSLTSQRNSRMIKLDPIDIVPTSSLPELYIPEMSQRMSASEDEPTTFDDRHNLECDGSLVDQALDSVMSLPQVVDSVAEKQREQARELGNQREDLSAAKKLLAAAEAKVKDLFDDISNISKDISLKDDIAANEKLLVEDLETGIIQLAKDNAKLKDVVEKKKTFLTKKQSLFEEYETKMNAHKEMVKEMEEDKPLCKEIKMQLDDISRMKKQKANLESNPEETDALMNGEACAEVQREINMNKQKYEKITCDCKVKGEQIQKAKQRQAQIKQDTEVLHKRNAAQLTRLKHRVKEMRSRNRQWQEEAARLEQSVISLKEVLDSI